MRIYLADLKMRINLKYNIYVPNNLESYYSLARGKVERERVIKWIAERKGEINENKKR